MIALTALADRSRIEHELGADGVERRPRGQELTV